ncbi:MULTISPECIES: molecular chaperone [unclassified Shewanella]|uniref:molecular chaperone n=1 Tax=unclassified Shewanella TaxID=196818 RepID=UPI000C82717C|nr:MULTISPECIES: molecular chaperone [unclassified Shewanella]MDO6618172.1 molecular chaperone [Shewanella sp. 6_MG-2023]MDO6638444.1 molecular chaperone [Shewanella sp. 5_MG-2023]MDO6774267.1 molecular chaperone [Shewanella sp. 3_MG-2023]PMH85860.1 molecular chaperone [Shewanella sp. 10N.286.48.B5]
MFIGFDYGSANCSVGIEQDGQVTLIPINGDSCFLSSTLYAMDRELIAEAVYHRIADELKPQYGHLRSSQLSRARQVRHELDIYPDEQVVFVGPEAIEAYLELPDEGFYVRSPKSFLGASGLRVDQVALFEDIVTLMMLEVMSRAKAVIKEPITKAVIGRPVNFQGVGGEESNQQAQAILETAAKRAGFEQVSFLFEPMAAAMDYEASMTSHKTVLVVDVGGGTTDCSMVKMGPELQHKTDRSDDVLGHSGQRVGGNDLDIAVAMNCFMPHLGLGSTLKNNLTVPRQPFWNGVAVNDISAQREFGSIATAKLIDELIKDAEQPALLKRLKSLRLHQMSYQFVRQAEQCKIGLSQQTDFDTDLSFIEANFEINVLQDAFEAAVQQPVSKLITIMKQAVESASAEPDVVYVTGGTAKSPVIHQCISSQFSEAEIIVGDHFGSVTSGLVRWAGKVFQH